MRWRDTTGRWSVPLLAIVLYPLAFGAAAVNLFMLALLGRTFGGPDLSPLAACSWGAVLGVPAAYLFARWLRDLMDEADAGETVPDDRRT
jgi:hypothetical protein